MGDYAGVVGRGQEEGELGMRSITTKVVDEGIFTEEAFIAQWASEEGWGGVISAWGNSIQEACLNCITQLDQNEFDTVSLQQMAASLDNTVDSTSPDRHYYTLYYTPIT